MDIIEQVAQFPKLKERYQKLVDDMWNNDWTDADIELRFELMQCAPDELRELALRGLRMKNGIDLDTPMRR